MLKEKRLIIISALLLLSICINIYQFSMNTKYKSDIKMEQENYSDIYNILNSITLDTFKDKVSSGETFTVYVGRPDCIDCNQFEPVFIDYLNTINTGDVFYLNVAKLREDEQKWVSFKNEFKITYTPTIAKYKSGVLNEKVEWTPETGINLNDVKEMLSAVS